MNTLGGLLVEEGTTYAGVDQQKLEYTFDDTNDVIYLFDADAEGNGTVEMIKNSCTFLRQPEQRNTCSTESNSLRKISSRALSEN